MIFADSGDGALRKRKKVLVIQWEGGHASCADPHKVAEARMRYRGVPAISASQAKDFMSRINAGSGGCR